MGGRGSSSGVSISGKTYGFEYKSLVTYGNIKFVVPIEKNTTAPMETMTKNRVYVTLNKEGNPKCISYYDKDNKRKKQIDLEKPHRGMLPHVHHGYNHNENDNVKGATKLNLKERELVYIAYNIWKEKKNDAWKKWKSSNK
ncbi:hypothetical protein KQI85_05450 [Falcatimonas sp. MSJ-15]|uniref:hypothetical protein n=1 Tax=Falcatimonas sp. MSJ-15 TaxID=2841515 RepID=UPI001C0FB9D0|nr:hypothetical protein [Falcatimonas sp. MSJ-15]MBU5469813.1 hypothetical protein [Falcatimonas sp. MSJ-15]